MQLDSNQKLTIIGLIIAIIIGSGYYAYKHLFIVQAPQPLLIQPVSALSSAGSAFLVHVCGAVKNEGVYKVRSDMRICDVIKLAGGGLPSADFSSVNLAEKIKDGEKIIILSKDRQEVSDKDEEITKKRPQKKTSKKVNINNASLLELDSLPGVGPATAKKIIEARPFSKVDDILKIPRFGKKKLEKLKDLVAI
ncbi:hypothetical protein A3J90_06270 [candidate division WOR-1 bacterium RIFOXYC2_FULL_37_10]|uniref:Helix-hairpin-helix DNA-binding motif class 1 domain-containing protein n=1 Tax=candidate division WOR-1 bacterium RIFOXYB2_FULL_37_13 TaxID=1802579 RepID=A0A1F4SF35_UNCSA|nr:MAG: hypothetical protein A2310_03295 [candidate division WOR-1 bacterium RIFOXYB2_FULL_37_13]OGC35708.1 MAG: hypothetical protein A3J90_06270 [candidate division WOR-1 bacterium RIFOXYC2_FULL_37_10]